MKIELAKQAQTLLNERDELLSLRHGIYKAMLPQVVVKRRVAEYDKRIDEIHKKIEAL